MITIVVEVGQQIAERELVAVVEAMKMENPVTAHKAGIVAEIHTEPGAVVAQGASIARIE